MLRRDRKVGDYMRGVLTPMASVLGLDYDTAFWSPPATQQAIAFETYRVGLALLMAYTYEDGWGTLDNDSRKMAKKAAKEVRAEDFAVAHGNPRPDPAPLIVVAVMLSRYEEDSWVDIHDTLGTILTLSERSRNDPAFQHESRDQAVIERALNAVPGREAWRPFEIEVDGTRRGCERQDVGGDWFAVHNLGDEYLYVHAQHTGSEVISVATIADITPYVDGNRRIGPLS